MMKCEVNQWSFCPNEATKTLDYQVTLGDPNNPIAADRVKQIRLCDKHAEQLEKDGGL